ncbi:MAG TPA: polymer-forming cytoskeletal protein [Longimicrobiales bacterium]|nr:polymer-forming cytoskeletal protein [Longimicrobiales bacterium]
MWKKDDMPETASTPRQETPSGYERSAPPRATGERATIGRSITINGEVSGDEDLLIQGRVDGSVNLKQHSVTVGPEGEVKANITARVVMVDGRVEGNIKAEEQVVLRSSALVEGDIAAPRVVLEDGARFRGGVDMGESLDRARAATAQSSSQARPATAGEAPKAGTPAGGEKSAGVTGGAPQAAAPGASR